MLASLALGANKTSWRAKINKLLQINIEYVRHMLLVLFIGKSNGIGSNG